MHAPIEPGKPDRTAPADPPMAGRAPAERYHNGVDSPRFYAAGRAVRGRPYVMVHTGDRARARVGSFVSIAPDVVLVVGGNHRIDWVSSFGLREIYGLPGAYVGNPWSRGDIEIGSDVTLGRGVRVRSGVTIADGAVVLPYSTVTKDVRPFAIVAGSPAREIGRRFADEEVDRLLRIAWWDWPLERIRRELGPVPADDSRAGAGGSAGEGRRARMTLDRLRRRLARTLHRVALRLDPDPAAAEIVPAVDPALLRMGRRSYFAPIVRADAAARHRVTIGNYSSVAFDAEFLLETAALPSPRSALALGLGEGAAAHPRLRSGDIVVGADCWITRGVRVYPGVTIGAGAVVAAYSVVTEDVRPYAIVAGNPARETGRRFDDDTVAALLAISWWDWPEEIVKERYGELCSADVASFVARYRPGVR